MRKLFLLFVAILATTSLWANSSDFISEELHYKITSDSTVEVIGYCTWNENHYHGHLITATVPPEVSYDGVTYRVTGLGSTAFACCESLTSITLPNTLTYIENMAFYNCIYLPSIIIPSGVQRIGSKAFYWCKSLTSIILPESVVEIGNSIFEESSIKSIVLSSNITAIPNNCFKSSSISSISVPKKVTEIGESAFVYTPLKSITIPENVISLGRSAFPSGLDSVIWNAKHCENTTNMTLFKRSSTKDSFFIRFGDKVEHIPSRFLDIQYLDSIIIPRSVTSIGNDAFACEINKTIFNGDINDWCRINYGNDLSHPNRRSASLIINNQDISKIVIPNDVEKIDNYTFYGCSSLASLFIHDGVKNIGTYAFGNCKKLHDIYCHAVEPPVANQWSFANYNVNLYVPCESLQDYQMDAVFGAFKYIRCLDEVVMADELPIVALYDWLLMLNVNEINEMGYYFSLSDVRWYRVVGEPDDIYNNFPLDDQLLAESSSYLTLDQNLNGTGNYYAVVKVNGADTENLLRSEIISYSGRKQPDKLALYPNAITMGQSMLLSGLNPKENTEISVYSVTGQLVETRVSKGESTISLGATRTRGLYQVLVKSGSDTETLSYIVK